jgi:PAS domain-containing protein
MPRNKETPSANRRRWRRAADVALRRPSRTGSAARSKSTPTDDVIRLAEKLREGEPLYWQLAENLQEVLWVGTPDWEQVLYVNPAYERLWGRTRQSLYENPMSWIDAECVNDNETPLTRI